MVERKKIRPSDTTFAIIGATGRNREKPARGEKGIDSSKASDYTQMQREVHSVSGSAERQVEGYWAMEPWLLVGVVASLVLSLYTGFRLFMLLGRINQESRKSFEIAQQLQEDWGKFTAREQEARERLSEQFDRCESATRDRVERFEKLASGTRERLIKLEQYLKEFFEVELKAVFDSFDKTVVSILDEMKSELLRGVERIEDIQAVVDSKSFAQDRILDGEGSVYRLIADTGDEAVQDAAESDAAETAEAAEESVKDPTYRLQADEAEQ